MTALLDGRFRLDRVIGAGGHAQVWRGHDLARDVPVAVKLVSPAADAPPDVAERLLAEAAVLAGLRVPGIVGYVTHGRAAGGQPYLVEDWLEGPTVRERLESPGLTAVEAVALVARIAAIAGAAHAAGVIHRDLKPENVILAGGELASPRLIDFGLSRFTGAPGVTRTGTIVGTVGYLAPEQARGNRDLDVRVDVFALGCLLYEALTGRPAFAGSGLLAVSAKVQFHDPTPLVATCPEAAVVAPLLALLLAKDRRERPANGHAVASALAALHLTAGPRRTSTGDEVATVRIAPRASAVIAVGSHRAGDDAADRWRAVGDGWRGPGRAAGVDAATLLVELERAAPLEAATAARALAAALPEATVVIVTAPRDELLDRGFALVERAALHDVFGGAGVRVDADTAALLPPAATRLVDGEPVLVES